MITLLAFALKDWRLMFRDRVALLFLLLAPVVVISVAGFSLSTLYGTRGAKGMVFELPVADEDGGEVARSFLDALRSAGGVAVELVSEDEARSRVARSRGAGAAVVIPHGFSDAFRRGQPAPVTFLTDPVKHLEVLKLRSEVERAYFGLMAVRVAGRVAVMEVLTHGGDADLEDVAEDAALVARKLVERSRAIEERSLTSVRTTFNAFDQNVPGFGVTFLLLGTLFGVGLGLADEREWGISYRLRASPVPLRYLVLGKVLSRFAVGVVQMAILFFIGRVAFEISLGSSLTALALLILAVSLAAAAFGLLVAALAPTRDAVLPLGTITVVGMTAVGGCWWPITLEPEWLQRIALFFPTAWAMEGFNDLMLRERGLREVGPTLLALLLFAGAYVGVGQWLYVRREAGSQ